MLSPVESLGREARAERLLPSLPSKFRERGLAVVLLLSSFSLSSCGPDEQAKAAPVPAPVITAPVPEAPSAPVEVVPPPVTAPITAEPASVASNFDVNSELVPSWGTGAIPPTDPANGVGAFRFICNASHLAYDDPIVYPGQAGKSHLHQFFGNTEANANSTYESLRKSGNSTCNSPLNRSAYWMPAMLDGVGHVIRPDFISIYYKRRPQMDPKCKAGNPQAEGTCVNLPRGLRFVFGYNMLNANSAPTGAAYFNCDGPTAVPDHYATITEAAKNCPVGNKLGAVIMAPSCWDGRNLDSADHRSHVAYAGYGTWGYLKCPDTHPYVIPQFQLGAWFTVDANLGTWRLSSDDMTAMGMGMKTPGSTFHADWFGGWDDNVMKTWHDNCIDKLQSCTGGDLGNGKQLKMFSAFAWEAAPRLVPVPARP
jgi:hypothetical protein